MPRRLRSLELSGEQVRLRPHRSSDAAAAYAMLAREEAILRWLVWDGPTSEEELAEYYGQRELLGSEDLSLAIEERSSGTLLGSISLRFTAHPGQGDVGYWVGVRHQGRGVAREALSLVAHFAFVRLGAQALTARVFVGNATSRFVLERTGFSLTRTVVGRVRKRERTLDEWHFVMLANDWRRLRADFRPLEERVAWREPDSAPCPPEASNLGQG